MWLHILLVIDFVYLGTVVEKSEKIQNEANGSTGKPSKFYHLTKS
jgi:hypothetical protein